MDMLLGNIEPFCQAGNALTLLVAFENRLIPCGFSLCRIINDTFGVGQSVIELGEVTPNSVLKP